MMSKIWKRQSRVRRVRKREPFFSCFLVRRRRVLDLGTDFRCLGLAGRWLGDTMLVVGMWNRAEPSAVVDSASASSCWDEVFVHVVHDNVVVFEGACSHLDSENGWVELKVAGSRRLMQMNGREEGVDMLDSRGGNCERDWNQIVEKRTQVFKIFCCYVVKKFTNFPSAEYIICGPPFLSGLGVLPLSSRGWEKGRLTIVRKTAQACKHSKCSNSLPDGPTKPCSYCMWIRVCPSQ